MLDPMLLQVDVLQIVQDPKRAPKGQVLTLFLFNGEIEGTISLINTSGPVLRPKRRALRGRKTINCSHAFIAERCKFVPANGGGQKRTR